MGGAADSWLLPHVALLMQTHSQSADLPSITPALTFSPFPAFSHGDAETKGYGVAKVTGLLPGSFASLLNKAASAAESI